MNTKTAGFIPLDIKNILANLRFSTPFCSQMERNPPLFNRQQQNECQLHYQLLGECLLHFGKHPDKLIRIRSLLSHFEMLSFLDRLATEPVQPLTIEQFFLLKKFLLLWFELIPMVTATPLPPLPRLEKAVEYYQMLDPDVEKKPTFAFTGKHTPRLSILCEELRDIQQHLEETEAAYWGELKARWQIPIGCERISLSKLHDGEAIEKWLKSDEFYIIEENYANIIFAPRRPPEALELDRQQNLILRQISDEEENVARNLTTMLIKNCDFLFTIISHLAQIDRLLTFVTYGLETQSAIPQLNNETIRIKAGQFIFTARQLDSEGIQYQPLTIELDQPANILTGMNMGGKSILLRSLGFLCYHLKLGLPVPAESFCGPLFDEIFYLGEETRLSSHTLSSYSREIEILIDCLNRPGLHLFLIDELSRGSNPSEAVALNTALMDELQQSGHWFALATHFDIPRYSPFWQFWQMRGLEEIPDNFWNNLQSLAVRDRLQQLQSHLSYQARKIEAQTPIPLEALHIAEILGLPPTICKKAKELLNNPIIKPQ